MVILRTNTSNILPSVKEIMRINTIKTTALIVATTTTAIVEVMTIFIDGIAVTEAERANAIYARRRTAVYRDIY